MLFAIYICNLHILVSPKRKGKPVRSNSKSRKGASTRTQPLGEINDPNNIVQVDVPEKENGEFAETTIESDDGESPEKKDASHVKNNSSVPKNSSGHKSSGKHGDKQLNDPDPDNQSMCILCIKKNNYSNKKFFFV